MNKKDKELLLKDLSARLPYKVKVKYNKPEFSDIIVCLKGIEENLCTIGGTYTTCRYYPIFDDDKQLLVPYLRPMSSVTEEEKKEYDSLFKLHEDGNVYCENWEYFDWMNKHYFDYRGLIERGFALEAPEGMYKID